MSEQDAQLVELLDGKRTVAELLVEASNRLGPSGAGRLARLVADFGERGMLDGVAPTPVPQEEPGFFARAFKTREKTFGWIPEYFKTAYRHWGRLFFSPLMVTCLVLLSLAGLVVFSYLVGARYGTPFVVAHRLVLGGLVFLAGRFAIVMVHELAHGLALAHYGRSHRPRRVPAAVDLPVCVRGLERGLLRVAHAPDRDQRGRPADGLLARGVVLDPVCGVAEGEQRGRGVLPARVRRATSARSSTSTRSSTATVTRSCASGCASRISSSARASSLRERLTGQRTAEESSPVLARYAIAGLVWSALGAGFVAVLSLRYYSVLVKVAPKGVVVGGFILFFVVLLLPIPLALGTPLLHRARYGSREVNRVIK